MAKFCMKCGKPLNAEGFCDFCNAKEEEPREALRTRRVKKCGVCGSYLDENGECPNGCAEPGAEGKKIFSDTMEEMKEGFQSLLRAGGIPVLLPPAGLLFAYLAGATSSAVLRIISGLMLMTFILVGLKSKPGNQLFLIVLGVLSAVGIIKTFTLPIMSSLLFADAVQTVCLLLLGFFISRDTDRKSVTVYLGAAALLLIFMIVARFTVYLAILPYAAVIYGYIRVMPSVFKNAG